MDAKVLIVAYMDLTGERKIKEAECFYEENKENKDFKFVIDHYKLFEESYDRLFNKN